MILNDRLEKKLEEIANFLLHHHDDNSEIGVLTGISGNALFHFYYGDYKNDDRHLEKGVEIILEVFDRIQKGYTYPTFCDGIAGACWALEILKEEKKIELEEDIITEEVDLYLYNAMNDYISENNFDFLHGAIGIGIYFLKRYQNAVSHKFKNRYEKYLTKLLIEISKKSIKKEEMVAWESDIISGEYKTKGCNLGLAHGIPSIVYFLSELQVYPAFYHITNNLIKPTCNYIINQKNNTSDKFSSSFPNWITKDKVNDTYDSRLAWCYGDLGIGVSILKASQTLNDDDLLNESIDIINKSINRKNIELAGVKDAGLCHGAHGVMLLYKHFFDQTKITSFNEASKYWADIGLNLAINKDSYAGYKEYDIPEWRPNSNFLGGISGIGLAILNSLGYSSNWSEALLIK